MSDAEISIDEAKSLLKNNEEYDKWMQRLDWERDAADEYINDDTDIDNGE
jgi:hypothetical protein